MSKSIRRLAILALAVVIAALVIGCIPPVVTPTVMRFDGNADRLTDPFILPAGTYRANVQTTGYVIVRVIPVAIPDDDDYLFILSAGDATNGASVLYVSSGDRIMLEFSNITAPYELWFEKVT